MKLKITLNDLSKIWFTTDLHFGHKNITGPNVSNWKSGYRTFNSIPEMDQTLLDGINRNIEEDDILFHLGDFSYLSMRHPMAYRQQINCKEIYHIMGNHDDYRQIVQTGFTQIFDTLELRINGDLKLWLSHYAHAVWPESHRGTIHLFGHSHGTFPNHGKSFDVCPENAYKMFGEYRPFNLLTDIIPMMENKSIAFVDHHNETTLS